MTRGNRPNSKMDNSFEFKLESICGFELHVVDVLLNNTRILSNFPLAGGTGGLMVKTRALNWESHGLSLMHRILRRDM